MRLWGGNYATFMRLCVVYAAFMRDLWRVYAFIMDDYGSMWCVWGIWESRSMNMESFMHKSVGCLGFKRPGRVVPEKYFAFFSAMSGIQTPIFWHHISDMDGQIWTKFFVDPYNTLWYGCTWQYDGYLTTDSRDIAILCVHDTRLVYGQYLHYRL